MPARKWIQRRAIRKFVLKSEGKLILGPRIVARAALGMMLLTMMPPVEFLTVSNEFLTGETRDSLCDADAGLYTLGRSGRSVARQQLTLDGGDWLPDRSGPTYAGSEDVSDLDRFQF